MSRRSWLAFSRYLCKTTHRWCLWHNVRTVTSSHSVDNFGSSFELKFWPHLINCSTNINIKFQVYLFTTNLCNSRWGSVSSGATVASLIHIFDVSSCDPSLWARSVVNLTSMIDGSDQHFVTWQKQHVGSMRIPRGLWTCLLTVTSSRARPLTSLSGSGSYSECGSRGVVRERGGGFNDTLSVLCDSTSLPQSM